MRPVISPVVPLPDRTLERLSPRERQIAGLLLEGLKPSIIGRRLGIAESTVRNSIRRIQWRLMAASRADITACATAHNATHARWTTAGA